MDYFTANQLALNSGADRFMYGGKYAAVDPGLLSNYKDNMDAGFSEETAYGMIKPWGANVERDKIREATIGMPMNTHTGSAAPRSAEETRLIAEGFTRDHDKFIHLWHNGSNLITSIPGYSTHMEVEYLSPTINWEKLLIKEKDIIGEQ